MPVAKGDIGTFFLDAAAHAAGVGLPATVVATPDGITCSLVVAFDPPRVYGPVIPDPYGFTYNATPVTTTSGVGGYYFLPSETVESTAAVAANAALAATDASAQAGLDQTPLALVRVDAGGGGGWTYNLATSLWETRQPLRTLTLWYSCPTAWASLRWIVRDYPDLVAGKVVVQVLAAPRFSAVGAVNYTTRATWASAGTGVQQEQNQSLTPPMAQTIVRVEVSSGSFGPTAIGAEYRFEQISPEV